MRHCKGYYVKEIPKHAPLESQPLVDPDSPEPPPVQKPEPEPAQRPEPNPSNKPDPWVEEIYH